MPGGRAGDLVVTGNVLALLSAQQVGQGQEGEQEGDAEAQADSAGGDR